MPAPTAYASSPQTLENAWNATTLESAFNAPSASPIGGFARPAPPAPSPSAVADSAWAANTYTDGLGNRQWLPTPEEAAWHRRNGFPVPGIDDMPDVRARPPRPVANPAASVGSAASGSLDDVMRGVGGAGGLATGGLLAGGFAGYAEYQSGGGVASAVGVGVGAGLGSAVGTVVGGVAGSALGPVGTVVGSMIGGALGSALGAALGDALIPDANLNGAMAPGDGTTSTGGTPGAAYEVCVYGGILYGVPSDNFQIIPNFIGPLVIVGPFVSYPSGRYYKQVSIDGAEAGGAVTITLERDGSNGPILRGQQYSIRRTDGGYDPQTYNPNTRERPAYGTPGFRLPGLEPRHRPDPTDQPYGRPGPAPRPWPFGEPRPIPTPDPTGDPTGDPYPYPDPNPGPNPTPGPGPNPGPYPQPDPNPNPNPDPDPNPDDNEPCDPCAKLDEIIELLKPEIAGQIDLSPCPVEGSNVEDIRTIEGAGLVGISKKLGLSLQSLDALWELLRCQEDTILTVPEHWPLRRGAERPQLIVVYSTQNQDGSWGNSRCQFSIPWFDHRLRKTLKSMLPKQIRKGPKQGTILLTDNSKMTLFCSTHQEAERVLKAFENLVIRRYRTGDVRFSDLNGNGKRGYNRVTVFPFVAKYYPAGMRNLSPAWTDKLY